MTGVALRTVRVLFHYTSMEERVNSDVFDDIRHRDDYYRVARREVEKGECLAREMLMSLFGDVCHAKTIIQATLILRTVQGLKDFADKTIFVLDANPQQIMELAHGYELPPDGEPFEVLFVRSWIDVLFSYKTEVLRTVSANQVTQE